jgi:hypothetical protein
VTDLQVALALSYLGAPINNPTRDLKWVGMASARTYLVQSAPGVPGRYTATFVAANDGSGDGIVTFSCNVPVSAGPEIIPQIDTGIFSDIECISLFAPPFA